MLISNKFILKHSAGFLLAKRSEKLAVAAMLKVNHLICITQLEIFFLIYGSGIILFDFLGNDYFLPIHLSIY